MFNRFSMHVALFATMLAMVAPGISQAQTCAPVQQCGDVDNSGAVASSDALKVLKKAVGQPQTLTCQCSEGSSGACADELAECSGDLTTCNGSFATCSGNLTTCNGNFTTCSGGLTTCSGNLTACSSNFTTCSGNLSTCSSDRSQCQAGLAACSTELTQAGDDREECQGMLNTCTGLLQACNVSPGCGDGEIGAGEQCDVGDLNNQTCAGKGFAGGTLGCSFCQFDTSNCYASRFDASGSTILDRQTGLEWEKLVAGEDGTPHNVFNLYDWSESGAAPDGGAFLYVLPELNSPIGPGAATANGSTNTGCYANHCDWRLPTIKELRTIAVPGCGTPPCVVDAAFLPTRWEAPYDGYWTVSSEQGVAQKAWSVHFSDGSAVTESKTIRRSIRAVRGGS